MLRIVAFSWVACRRLGPGGAQMVAKRYERCGEAAGRLETGTSSARRGRAAGVRRGALGGRVRKAQSLSLRSFQCKLRMRQGVRVFLRPKASRLDELRRRWHGKRSAPRGPERNTRRLEFSGHAFSSQFLLSPRSLVSRCPRTPLADPPPAPPFSPSSRPCSPCTKTRSPTRNATLPTKSPAT